MNQYRERFPIPAAIMTRICSDAWRWLIKLYRQTGIYFNKPTWCGYVILSLGIVVAYLICFISNAAHPRILFNRDGWWDWWDQSQYLKGALAFAKGNLAADQQWYMPGYSLLAAIFYKLFHIDPFLLLDACLLLIALAVFIRLSGYFTIKAPAAAAIFIASVILPYRLFEWTWVTPWTTTPQTVCCLCAILFALKTLESHRPRDIFLFGLAGSAIALFRPTDAFAILVPGSCCLILALISSKSINIRRAVLLIGSLLFGIITAAVFSFTVYYAIFGWELSPYMRLSKIFGFEWRLIPIRWVTLFIDSRPFYDASRGLIERYPWIILGVAGMGAQLFIKEKRMLHLILISTVISYCSLYLAYRDWHVTGLWKWGSVHYFTWLIPCFGFYAYLWLSLLKAKTYPPAAAGALIAIMLICWRIVPDIRVAGASAYVEAPNTAYISSGLANIRSGIFISATNHGLDSDLSNHRLWIADREMTNFSDFRVYPTSTGVIIFPLRPLPRGPVRIEFGDDIALSGNAPVTFKQKIRFGFPCFFMMRMCQNPYPLK